MLDFGAAKALSLSRKVTRNDFGSIAYLSPECLESGDRDLHSDAWALGVLLYEMVRGRAPFRADDTRLLEQRSGRGSLRSRSTGLSAALEAIIAKLLAPYPRIATRVRRRSARISRACRRAATSNALAEGWPGRQDVELPTRRTHPPIDSRSGHEADAAPVRHDPPALRSAHHNPVRRRCGRRRSRNGAGESRVCFATRRSSIVSRARAERRLRRRERATVCADTVPLQDFAGLSELWPQYETLAGRSTFGWGVGATRERADAPDDACSRSG